MTDHLQNIALCLNALWSLWLAFKLRTLKDKTRD